MKKQFLFLVFLVMAAFANITSSYGQCTPSELNPGVGVAYTYTVTAGAQTGQYLWYVTKNTDLEAGGATPIQVSDGLFTIGGGSAYNNTTGGTKSLIMTWTTGAVSDGGPFYLVVKYTEAQGSCTAGNMRVW